MSDPAWGVVEDFDASLFEMCRNDDYVGIFREMQRRVGAWQPIETAPKDGTPILLYGGDPPADWTLPEPSGWSICHWRDGQWMEATGQLINHHESPTHWMPLPAPPK